VRESIIEILEDKFGKAPDRVIEATETLTDLELLRKLLKLAAKSPSLDQFTKKFDVIVVSKTR